MGRIKQTAADLAICGGPRAFQQPVRVGRPNIGDRARFFERIDAALDRGWLTNNGPLVGEFERRVAGLLGVRHCVATCSGTIGLLLTVRAMGLRGEVIVPAFTFIATANVLEWSGIRPVFCDVDRETHNLDPRLIDALVTPATSAILGVHLWGRPCDVESITATARRRGLAVLFDAAHAFGCSHGGRMVGNFGDAEVFSFHATKVLNTFEGGAVVTNNSSVADAVRRARDHGFSDTGEVVTAGINGRMSEPSAAMGLTGLESLDWFLDVNRANHREYSRLLDGVPGLRIAGFPPSERSNFQYVVVEVDPASAGLTRDELLRVLVQENVTAKTYFHPGCHRATPYLAMLDSRRLTVTDSLAATVLTLPTGTAVDAETISAICAIIRVAVEDAAEVRHQLGCGEKVPGGAAELAGREGRGLWSV
jgi:dTDP-4-amino-4,6-dideoxygalactose transaminase